MTTVINIDFAKKSIISVEHSADDVPPPSGGDLVIDLDEDFDGDDSEVYLMDLSFPDHAVVPNGDYFTFEPLPLDGTTEEQSLWSRTTELIAFIDGMIKEQEYNDYLHNPKMFAQLNQILIKLMNLALTLKNRDL
jgi:hypothetical protein